MPIAGQSGPDHGASPPPDPFLGTSIDGIKLHRRLGEGSFGVVYEGQQDKPRRLVAVKIMRPHTATPELASRFEYEAEILAQLNHPGIATIHKVGALDVHSAKVPYLIMEYVPNARPLTTYASRWVSISRVD